MAIKVYISQANQVHNVGPDGYDERSGMRAIQKLAVKFFAKDKRFSVKMNALGINTASENVAEANRWGANVYIALHSNASGVSGRPAKGTIGFCSSRPSKSYAVANAIVARVGKLAPGGNKGVVVRPGLIEVGGPSCPAALIELEGHDWIEGVRFLRNAKKEIAYAIYTAVCASYGMHPRPRTTGKVIRVPVPSVRPAWWAKLRAYLKRLDV